MSSLNFPAYTFKIKTIDGKKCIYDRLRRKFLVLQPEEWVRQHMIEFLIEELGYPEGLIGNEISLTYNGLQKRCDSVVYNRNREPLMIVEYKAPNVEITQKTFDQISLYNTQLKVKFLLISNGFKHYCCKVDLENNKLSFLKEIPSYEEISFD